MKKTLLIDTNILLHYIRLDHIDWLKETGATEAKILVVPVVIAEIEKHKISHPIKRLRKRAVDYVKWFNSLVSDGLNAELRPGVTLQFVCAEPALDFEYHQLDKETADDRLIAHAIELQQDGITSLSIVAADTGVRLKALARKLDVIFWADNDYKLKEEEDQEQKRIRELEREIQKRDNKAPLLRLLYEDGAQHIEHVLVQRSQRDFDEIMGRLRHRYQLLDITPVRRQAPPTGNSLIDRINRATEATRYIQEVSVVGMHAGRQRYNSELPRFFERYEEYLSNLYYFQSHVIRLDLVLANNGTCVADDVYIKLTFPKGLDVRDEFDVPVEPDSPEPPKPGENPWSTIGYGHLLSRNLFLPAVPRSEPNVKGPRIDTVSGVASYQVRKAKHNVPVTLDPIYVVYEDIATVENFGVEYALHADNLPAAIEGELSVVIRTE